MLDKKIDLTQLCALKEIQFTLVESVEYEGNFILQNSFYKQQIIEYILSNLNHRYFIVKNLTEIPKKASDILPHCPIEEKIAIRQLMQLKMSQIVRELLEQNEQKTNSIKIGQLK